MLRASAHPRPRSETQNLYERQNRGPFVVHAPDLIVEVAATEDVKDDRVAITRPDHDICPVLGAVLQTHADRLIVLDDHILDPAFAMNLATELLIVLGHPEDDPLRSSERLTRITGALTGKTL